MKDNLRENPDLDALLIEAMESEVKAKEFYLDASEKAQSQAGKKFFQELADFESNHYKRVKRIIDMRKTPEKLRNLSSEKEMHLVNAEIEGEFEPNKDEIVQVIHLAIKAEKNAQQRYRKIADLFIDKKEKQIFERLAEEERNHQTMLENQFYHMSNKGTIIWE